MISRRILKTINWLLVALVVGVPLVYWKWSLYPYAIPKTAFAGAVIDFIFAFWLVLAASDKRFRPRMTPLAWAIAAYLGVLSVTAFTGVDAWRSFFSDIERAFGIITYYHFAALALVISSLYREIPWKKLWFFSFGTSLAVTGLAFIQLAAPTFLLSSDSPFGRPGSTFGNPTFLAGYLLFNILLAGYFLIADAKNRELKTTLLFWATIVFGTIGIFITETRGDILGLFAGAFALAVLFAFRPPAVRTPLLSHKRFYAMLVIVLLAVGGGVWTTRSSSIWSHVPGIDRLKDLTLSGDNSDIGPRVMALNAAWQGFLNRPLLGWGYENFNVVFNAHYDPRILEYGYAESNFDKPHNIILEQLDAGGLLLLLAYLGVLAALIYESWKIKNNLLGQVIVGVVVAYFVRSVVIFDTLGPVMMLYLLMGWIDGAYQATQFSRVESKDVKKTIEPDNLMLALAGVGALIVAYAFHGSAVQASYFAWQGHESLQVLNDTPGGISAFEAGATTWNIYQWDFTRDYVNTLAEAYFNNPAGISSDAIKTAVDAMKAVAVDHPNDAYNHYVLTSILNLTHAVDPKNYLQQAEAQARIALGLSPGRQEIYFYLARTKSFEGDNAAALDELKTALELDPKVPDSHFYYGMLAFANGKNDLGYAEVKEAIAMKRNWTNANEPRVAADYFADSGHLGDALELYQASLALDPGNLETATKIGIVYYLQGNKPLARQSLLEVASKFDFTTSPSYASYKPILDDLGIH